MGRVLPPSPQKMKLMLLAILTAFVVSVNTDSGASFYRRGLRHQPDCDCDYFPGGCRIVAPVKMANRACRCQYSFLWTCTGLSVPCRNSNSNFCKTPGTSLEHCRQGGGDCG